MKFQAQVAGAEIKDEPKTTQKQADSDKPSLADRLRARRQQEREDTSKVSKTPSEFSHGVGYQLVGG